MAQSKPFSLPSILVVEDEGLVRMDLVDVIQSEGFPTYEAANADEAIRILEAHPEIHILFTDIDMPGTMDGLKLSHYVRDRWPPVRIFVTSGHHKANPDLMPSEAMFVSKPYEPVDMARIFRSYGVEAG